MLWLPKVFADYQESEGQVMEETETESTWEERAVVVLEQILSSKLETPPPIPTIPFFEKDEVNATDTVALTARR